jgi:hypothetical protein
MSETRILIRLLRMYFLRNWEFGSACQNFGISGGRGERIEPSNHPSRCTTELRYHFGGKRDGERIILKSVSNNTVCSLNTGRIGISGVLS